MALSELDWLRLRCRAKRIDEHLSLRQAADILHSSAATLMRFERGTSVLKGEAMLALQNWLEVKQRIRPTGTLEALLTLVYTDPSLEPAYAQCLAGVIEHLYQAYRARNGVIPDG